MNFLPFIFVDRWKMISYTGEYLNITNKDLKNYRENGLTDSEIKAISYSYLTSLPTLDLQKLSFQTYEFWYKNSYRSY